MKPYLHTTIFQSQQTTIAHGTTAHTLTPTLPLPPTLTMGAAIPFSEPPWLMGLPTPIYQETHRKWQAAIRAFIEKHLLAHAEEWERAETVPAHVFDEFAAAGMLIPALPAPLPVAWLKRLGFHELLGGLPVEDFDYLHAVIYADEMARSGLAGPPGSLTTGMAFGVPPIIKFGSNELQERFLPELLRGQKRSCIAITEPDAGSDVANITTTAVKSKDGKHYIINGTKKWYGFSLAGWVDAHLQTMSEANSIHLQDHQWHLDRLRQHGRSHRARGLWPRRPLLDGGAIEGLPRRLDAASEGSRANLGGDDVH